MPSNAVDNFKAGLRRHWLPLLALLIFAVGWRVAIYRGVPPIHYPDSASYIAAARSPGLLSPSRTPGYPAWLRLNFLLFGDGNFRAVILSQKALGVLTNLLIYLLFWRLTGSRALGLVAALATILHVQILSFEHEIWTEAISPFFVTLTVAAVVLFPRRSVTYPGIVALGLLTAALIMIKPVFIFACALVGLCLLIPLRRLARLRCADIVLRLMLLAWINITVVLWWSGQMRRHYDVDGLSKIAPINIVTVIATRDMLDRVPERYAPVVRIIRNTEDFGSLYDVLPKLRREVPGFDHTMLHRMAMDTLGRAWPRYLWEGAKRVPESMSNQYASLALVPDRGMSDWARRLYVVIEDAWFWAVGRASPILFPLLLLPVIWWTRGQPARMTGWILILLLVWYVVGMNALLAYAEFGRHRNAIEPLKVGAIHAGAAMLLARIWQPRRSKKKSADA